MREVGKICDFWSISRCISVTVRGRVWLLYINHYYEIVNWLSIGDKFNDRE